MTHSFRVHYFHIIWSTKNRTPWIDPEIQPRLYSYLGAIIKNHKGRLLEIGGMADHVHLLIELSSLDKFSHIIRDLKSSSSLWIHKTYPDHQQFAWQEGYASYTVSYSALEAVSEYIRNQEKHHAGRSFEEEYKRLLHLNRVEYDERFVLG